MHFKIVLLVVGTGRKWHEMAALLRAWWMAKMAGVAPKAIHKESCYFHAGTATTLTYYIWMRSSSRL